jgi:hypothetical protein
VPSASRNATRSLALAGCGLLLAGAAAGCQTTQEKAAIHQARSERILEARAQRQKARKHHADGPKTSAYQQKSAHRHGEGKQ